LAASKAIGRENPPSRRNRRGPPSPVRLGVTALDGRLVYAGSVTPKLEGQELADFTKALEAVRMDRPFLDIQSDSVWVRPKFSCRVSHTEQDEAGHLSNAEWVKLLGATGL
jgi:ATP-dependent DNA ligase